MIKKIKIGTKLGEFTFNGYNEKGDEIWVDFSRCKSTRFLKMSAYNKKISGKVQLFGTGLLK